LPGQRLDHREVRSMCDGFLCDYLWMRQKLARGELIAAQRMLHRSLAEINYQLLHEIRLREGEPSFREARRLEKLLPDHDLVSMQVSSHLNADELSDAADKCFDTMKACAARLVPA